MIDRVTSTFQLVAWSVLVAQSNNYQLYDSMNNTKNLMWLKKAYYCLLLGEIYWFCKTVPKALSYILQVLHYITKGLSSQRFTILRFLVWQFTSVFIFNRFFTA